jgi:cytochrome P450
MIFRNQVDHRVPAGQSPSTRLRSLRSLRASLSVPRPPGPRGLPVFGPIQEYARDPFGFLINTKRIYGDVVALRFAGRQLYLISHPDAIERVLVTHKKNYPKSDISERLYPLIGQGLLTSEGELWTQQRKLISPAFHHKRIRSYAQTMVDRTEAHLSSWQDRSERSVDTDMMHLTLDIALRTLFGEEQAEGEQLGRAFTEASEYFAVTLKQPFPIPLWVPTPKNKMLLRARDQMFDYTRRIIQAKRQQQERGDDLLSTLIEATDESGARMDDDQLRDEVLTLLLAGHETTALTLTYAFDLLGRHPHVRDKLEAELDSVLGGRSPTIEDLPQLRYTTQVIKESMRLFPPGAVMLRQAVEDDEVGGWIIPKGAMVAFAQWIVHRDARWFENPELFLPERWTKEFEEALPRFAYFPFGGGPRICVGASFAMMEAPLVLASIAQKFRLDLLDLRPLELLMSITVRPRRSVRAAVRKRRASPRA